MKVLKVDKKHLIITLLLIITITAHNVGLSYSKAQVFQDSSYDMSEEELLQQIQRSTSSLTELYNDKKGIFLWNIQTPQNLSRYGDNYDLSNGDESLDDLDSTIWLNGLAQDIAMQYLLLNSYVSISLQFSGSHEEHVSFNREWILMTENIISSLYYKVAIWNQLIDVLELLPGNDDAFGSYWNFLIRPKYNDLLEKRISLLPDTLALGSKLLRVVEFMPYFSFQEKSRIITLSKTVSNWWSAINSYALYDPNFAVTGLGTSKIMTQNSAWIGWNDFIKLSNTGAFIPENISKSTHLEFQRYIYTSPQLADQYLTYIEKTATEESYYWDEKRDLDFNIIDEIANYNYELIITNYSEHIHKLREKVVYVFNPKHECSWTPLPERFTGYSYYWEKYFINSQGLDNDLYQYRYDNSPLKITNARTYQGAGDIKGLMDVYKVLAHGFNFEYELTRNEKLAINIIKEIIKAQREDSSFILSPYFGTSLNSEIVSESLINDADVLYPFFLPEGLRKFTGTMSVFDFLLDAQNDINNFGYDSQLNSMKFELSNTIISIIDLLKNKIDPNTMGIHKQSIIGDLTENEENSLSLYLIDDITINIHLESENLPDWINNYNSLVGIGNSAVNQWNYLELLQKAFSLMNYIDIIEPLFDSLKLFNEDYENDHQYQLMSVCEVKDAVAREFFHESFVYNKIELCDKTGYFGNLVPYHYRDEVSPVTSVFAAETPQKVTAMILTIMPIISELLDVINSPINKVVIVGFLFGVIMTISVVYVRRPKHQ